MEDLKERLRPFRSRMFPQQVLLEITDKGLLAQPLLRGRPGEGVIEVPLPMDTIQNGRPAEIEPLADLIGDLLVRDGLIDAYVMASLPQEAVEWRVIHWADPSVPVDGLEALRQRNPELGLPFPLEEAMIDLRPLKGAPGKQLMAASRREVVEAWIRVFDQAGTNLDRLASPQACRLAALQGQLEEIPEGTLVVLLSRQEGRGQLMAIRDGVPLFEWPMSGGWTALVAEMRRCLGFLRREFRDVVAVRLLLDGHLAAKEELEGALELPLEELDCAPFGSLVLQGLAIPERLP